MIILVFLSFFVSEGLSQTWHTKACVNNYVDYLENLFQQTFYKLEKNYKFYNMKIDDFNHTINEQMYSWRVAGTVKYKNSFLISIEKVDVDEINSVVTKKVVDDVNIYQAAVKATIHFRQPRIGFDVLVKLDDDIEQHYTAKYMYTSISFPITILKNINTNETTFLPGRAGSSAKFQRMNYLPENSMTQVIGRSFKSYMVTSSFTKWAKEIIVPVMEELSKDIPFPSIRFDGCK